MAFMQKESPSLNEQRVKGRWQHPPVDLCRAVELQLWGLLTAEEATPTAMLLTWSRVLVSDVPRGVVEAGAIAGVKLRRPVAGCTICFSFGVNCEERKV